MGYRECTKQRRFQRRWMHRRRQEWIEQNGPCARCGSTEDLEVDHRDPGQKVDHRVWSWSWPRREKELRKCQVLCRTCHLAKTAAEMRGEGNPSVKLTETQVWEILEARRAGERLVDVAARYGIAFGTVGKITRGERWGHVHAAFHERSAA